MWDSKTLILHVYIVLVAPIWIPLQITNQVDLRPV